MAYEIGSRIRKYRETKNMTQKQLADQIGVTGSRVSNWEQGVNCPHVDLLADICRALSVSPSELLNIFLNTDELSEHERQIITAYRSRSNIQHAVDILLGVDEYRNGKR